MSNENFESISSRVRGCLFGGAAGDALGYAIEFSDEASIFSRYGESGITEYDIDPESGKALISDDTQMTLFTANGLLYCLTNNAINNEALVPVVYVKDAYLDWYLTQTFSFEARADGRQYKKRVSWLLEVPELYSRRAPGITCMSSLRQLRNHSADDFISDIRNDSKGCGGVMRVAPMGLCSFSMPIEKLDEQGAQLAAITHCNPLGFLPAAVLTHIIYRSVYLRNSESLKNIVFDAINTVCNTMTEHGCTEYLRELLTLAVVLSENGESDLDNIHRLGEGWVGEEALAIAIYCALKYENDFSKGITTAVNHKGDSDSTGAICGNILGAWLGYGAIEDKWKNELELSEVIGELADDICSVNSLSDSGLFNEEAWKNKYVLCKKQMQ